MKLAMKISICSLLISGQKPYIPAFDAASNASERLPQSLCALAPEVAQLTTSGYD